MNPEVIDYVKYGWRRNPFLSQAGEELSDEMFNICLHEAWQRVKENRRDDAGRKNLGEHFVETVRELNDHFNADTDDQENAQ